MNFKLTNYGRIREADVKLNGITVISGPNGSGKSTISRALFTWHTLLCQLPQEIPRERANIVSDDIQLALKQNGVSPYVASRFMPTYFRNRQPTKLIDPAFWRDEQTSLAWLTDRVGRFAPPMSSADEGTLDVAKLYAALKDRVMDHLNMDDGRIIKFIVERYFLKAFDGQIGSFFDQLVDSTVSLANDDGVAQSCTFLGGKAHDVGNLRLPIVAYKGFRMFYLEPRHLLDELSTGSESRVRRLRVNRYSVASELDWENILTKNLDRKSMSFLQVERMTPIFDELERIVSTIHGEIDTVDRSLAFRDSDIPGDNAISLQNVASGAKSIAAIVRGLRNDSIHPGDFLIIDEPESNLHPEWQLAFAKFLVLIHARLGIRLLLNTHSPYFLKAIEVYSDQFEQGDDCEYYHMVTKDRSQYATESATGRLQDVFKTMSAPFSRLMHGDHYECAIS